VQRLLTIGAAVDVLLLDPVKAATPDDMWRQLEPLAHQTGLNFQAFQMATVRVCERLNLARQQA
jgi:hypothetical protein